MFRVQFVVRNIVVSSLSLQVAGEFVSFDGLRDFCEVFILSFVDVCLKKERKK